MSKPEKLLEFSFNHTGAPVHLGRETGNTLLIQQWFDSRAQEVLDYVNALRDYEESEGAASGIGAVTPEGLTSDNVQGLITELAQAITDIVLGSIPDNSITAEKLSAALVSNLNSRVYRSGDTMAGPLVAQTNTEYTTRQVRNIIVSTADPQPGEGANGDLWIKYEATP